VTIIARTEPPNRLVTTDTSVRGTIVLVVFVLCYAKVAAALVDQWANSYLYSYGFLVPVISGYIVWARWPRIRALPPQPDYLLGVPTVLVASAMLALGHLGTMVTLQESSLVIMLVGLILLLFGRRVVTELWFPLAYLFLMVPVWDDLINKAQVPSQLLSARIAVAIFRAFEMPVLQQGTLIILPKATLEVLRECSGVNQLIAVLAMVLPIAYLFLETYARRVALVTVALIVAYLTNGLRIAVIGVLAQGGFGGADPRSPFHVIHGLVLSAIAYAFIGAFFFALVRSERRSGSRKSVAPAAPASPAPVVRRSVLEGTLVAVMCLAAAYTFAFRPVAVAPRHELRLLPGQIGDWTLDVTAATPRNYRFPYVANDLVQADGPPAERPVSFPDDELVRTYRSRSGQRLRLYIGYHRSQEHGKDLAGALSHSLRAAVSNITLEAVGDGVQINQVAQGRPGSPRGILFWYDVNGRIVTSTSRLKAYTIWDGLIRRRMNAAVVMIEWDGRGEDLERAPAEAIAFAEALLPVLRGYLPS
jgi:EpsI family protein